MRASSSYTTGTIFAPRTDLGGWRGVRHERGGRVGNQEGSERLQRDARGGRGRGARLGTFGLPRAADRGAAVLLRHLEERGAGAARPQPDGHTYGG